MIIVKMAVSQQLTADMRKEMARGVIDEYGNPFQIIKLRWNNSPNHRNADMAKTRGFEDAIISVDHATGDEMVTYRRPGAVTWQRPMGVGAFIGELANTPYNLQKLASCYGDKLWTITDPAIDAIVRAMYEKKIAKMTDRQKAIDEKRRQELHTNSLDMAAFGPSTPEEIDKTSIQEKNKLQMIKEQELATREAALKIKEQEILGAQVNMIKEGKSVTKYDISYLKSLKLLNLRLLCRELGIDHVDEDTRMILVDKIVHKQNADESATVTHIATIGDSLED